MFLFINQMTFSQIWQLDFYLIRADILINEKDSYDSTVSINIMELPHCMSIRFMDKQESFVTIKFYLDSLINRYDKSIKFLIIEYHGYSYFSNGGDICSLVPILTDTFCINKAFKINETLYCNSPFQTDSKNIFNWIQQEISYLVSNDTKTYDITEKHFFVKKISCNYNGYKIIGCD